MSVSKKTVSHGEDIASSKLPSHCSPFSHPARRQRKQVVHAAQQPFLEDQSVAIFCRFFQYMIQPFVQKTPSHPRAAAPQGGRDYVNPAMKFWSEWERPNRMQGLHSPRVGVEQPLHNIWPHRPTMCPHELYVLNEVVDGRFECVPDCPQSSTVPGDQIGEEQ